MMFQIQFHDIFLKTYGYIDILNSCRYCFLGDLDRLEAQAGARGQGTLLDDDSHSGLDHYCRG
jgi:hypothetical protein